MVLGPRPAEFTIDTITYFSSNILGNAFAIRKQMFIELGAYDEEMRDFAAENLEFSFRAWMCGAKIKIVPCSR